MNPTDRLHLAALTLMRSTANHIEAMIVQDMHSTALIAEAIDAYTIAAGLLKATLKHDEELARRCMSVLDAHCSRLTGGDT